jgi:hypothetical protein
MMYAGTGPFQATRTHIGLDHTVKRMRITRMHADLFRLLQNSGDLIREISVHPRPDSKNTSS